MAKPKIAFICFDGPFFCCQPFPPGRQCGAPRVSSDRFGECSLRVAGYVRDLVRAKDGSSSAKAGKLRRADGAIRTRRGVVVSAAYYVTSSRMIHDAIAFISLAEAQAYFVKEVRMASLAFNFVNSFSFKSMSSAMARRSAEVMSASIST